jgi:hypothetical protein
MSQNKVERAISIIRRCIGEKGVWASSGRYRNQCWTRDFCIATSFLFMHNPDLQNINLVLSHLTNIAANQKSNGKIPILFLDNEKEFLKDKIEKSIETKKISFMLQRYLDNSLDDLTPHTRDSEVLFIITVCELLLCSLSTPGLLKNPSTVHTFSNLLLAACSALKYIENNILTDGLIHGADWRDVRIDLDDKTVLTNACLLYRAYDLLSEVCAHDKIKQIYVDTGYHRIFNNEFIENALLHKKSAEKIKQIIQNDFWNEEYFNDYPSANKFDLLGNSLTIIYGIASKEQSELIFNQALLLSTPFGIKTTETFLPPLNEKEKTVMDRDNAVIWPFTNGFILNAMIMTGGRWIDVAKKEFSKWCNLDGFYEWYDIVDGQGYGSVDQVWSAALFLRVHAKLSTLNY